MEVENWGRNEGSERMKESYWCDMDEEINTGESFNRNDSDYYVCGDCGKKFKRGYRLGSHYWCDKCNDEK